MTIIEERIELAKRQQDILNRIFSNISEDRFNTKIALTDVSDTSLRDFWVYTSGFLGVQNYENSSYEQFTEPEAKSIIDGDFIVKRLNKYESKEVIKSFGVPLPKGGLPKIYPVYTIQDGTYIVARNQKISENETANFLQLKTNPARREPIDEGEPLKNPEISNSEFLKIIRNVLVHETPFIDGSEIVLFNNDELIKFSKMWLRGLSELFASSYVKLDTKEIEEEIINFSTSSNNTLQTKQDIDLLLRYLKPYFEQIGLSINQYSRLNNFIKLRVDYYKDFFQKNIYEKASIIAHVISNNPNYIKSPNETINPAIIYNLQQLVSSELHSRPNAKAYEVLKDEDLDYLSHLNSLITDYNEKLKDLNKQQLRYSIYQARFNKILLLKNQVAQTAKKKIQEIEKKISLESSRMQLFDISSLEFLPVEVAVNTISLMAYNNLITSGYFQDVMSGQDYFNLPRENEKLISKIDLSRIKVSTSRQPKPPYNYNTSDKAFILGAIRNGLCHGNIWYHLPPKTKNIDPSFKDCIVTFYAEHANVEVSASIEDFYKLFSSSSFFIKRDKIDPEIIAENDIINNSEDESQNKNGQFGE